MTETTVQTSASNNPFVSATTEIDATDGPQIVTIDTAANAKANTQRSFIKTDASANTVTIQDTNEEPLAVLEVQNDSVTLFRGAAGNAWVLASASSAADVSTHAALTTAHGADGELVGQNTLDAATNGVLADAAAAEAVLRGTAGQGYVSPEINVIRETAEHTDVLAFAPGGGIGTPAVRTVLYNANIGSDINIVADGVSGDSGFDFTPLGAGVIKEGGVPLAINCGSAQADSGATLVNDLVGDFNLLLAKLRTARVLLP